MIDAVKDYLVPKRFGIVGYVCVIVHFLCGLALTTVTAALRASENGKFSCSVDAKSRGTYEKQDNQAACFIRYDQAYNSPLPFYGFVPLSIGLAVFVSVVYSLIASARVDEIESLSHERQSDGEAENHGQDKKTVYVFYSYFIHLVLRVLFGIIFTVLQHTYFYPNGFHFEFSCSLTPKNASRKLNGTSDSITCENATASEKQLLGIIVSVINSTVALVILGEVIYLWRRLPILNRRSGVIWSRDTEFVRAHFLRKRYVPLECQLTAIECIYFYKQQVLSRPRFDFYIKVMIHTERAPHKFPKNMERHEIYDVYTAVPSSSARLEIKDLFYPNENAKRNFSRSILVIGRPGIGKTALTEKILREWAEANDQINEHYCNKIAFSFKLRYLNDNRLENISLKTFLQFGMGLSDGKFESIYEEITKNPQRVILIFDGLDEFHGNPINCLDQATMIPNDPNTCMSVMNLFVKLVLGDMLKGATVLVTSRPTAVDFYSSLKFDRHVEIIGFTSDRIEEYVNQFCDNHNRSDLKEKIWGHIESSSELLNLCYIPENCFIVCVTLSGCLSDASNDTGALPTTLTELYLNALRYYKKYDHDRNAQENRMAMTEEALKDLQQLAFRGMENDQLIFDQEFVDEQMKKSCLLNSLSNPIFPIQTQFCFIHFTIQEFLAARYVTETLAPHEITKFISNHAANGKWHLVLQFIAGLLGKKIKTLETEYKDCVTAFAGSFEARNDKSIQPDNFNNYNQLFVMKCLREVDDEQIVENVCETTAMNDIVQLCFTSDDTSPSDWATVTFVCKQMKNLVILKLFIVDEEYLQDVLELLSKRCINELQLTVSDKMNLDNVFGALMKLNCTLEHKHTTLTSLKLHSFSMTDEGLPNMCMFFKNGHASLLEILDIRSSYISSSAISKLCQVLNDERCTELTCLCLKDNVIGDEGANVLFDTLIKGLCKLTRLKIHTCSLTDRCIPSLVKALQDEHCQLTVLSLENNFIGDKGVGMLFENALTKEHCQLTKLKLDGCSLTDQCIPSLCKILQDERCQLAVLSLEFNNIGDEGAAMLFEHALAKEHCKLVELSLNECSLTDQCLPSLCKVLQDERCKLTRLWLYANHFTRKGEMSLHDVKEYQSCKSRDLQIYVRSL